MIDQYNECQSGFSIKYEIICVDIEGTYRIKFFKYATQCTIEPHPILALQPLTGHLGGQSTGNMSRSGGESGGVFKSIDPQGTMCTVCKVVWYFGSGVIKCTEGHRDTTDYR